MRLDTPGRKSRCPYSDKLRGVNAAAEKYDVAVSFAWNDEAAALSLKKALEPPLSVFVSSKAQEKLAGRDGNEAFRTVFRERAQLVVILYRPPWGETPWTRVEKMAIEELTHEKGWERLMFVRLDKSPVPKWVPKPHLYLDYTVYTLTDLVGAIKTRLVELDVEIRAVSPADRAAAMAQQRAFDEETLRRLTNSAQEFLDARDLLFAGICEEATLIAQQTGWPVATGRGAGAADSAAESVCEPGAGGVSVDSGIQPQSNGCSAGLAVHHGGRFGDSEYQEAADSSVAGT